MRVAGLWVMGCLLAASGCKEKPADPSLSAALEDAQNVECVVCASGGTHHAFPLKADTPQVVHEGKTHFFCSQMCKDAFLKDPQAYLKAPPAAQ